MLSGRRFPSFAAERLPRGQPRAVQVPLARWRSFCMTNFVQNYGSHIACTSNRRGAICRKTSWAHLLQGRSNDHCARHANCSPPSSPHCPLTNPAFWGTRCRDVLEAGLQPPRSSRACGRSCATHAPDGATQARSSCRSSLRPCPSERQASSHHQMFGHKPKTQQKR